ncbi:MAG: hypothetical protein FOGNACKC_04153 [Anaerolineae bacterium]|nr:hypothetical protein [Anaerolineae bacterium]
MFNLPEFHEVQNQHCKDLQAEADRERLALQAQQARQPAKLKEWLLRLMNRE